MATYLDKFKVKTAVEARSKMDFGCDHISTASWMQYNVAYWKELVPTEKVSVSMETFTRLLPLARPTFGRATINNRAFFVPYENIFPGWDDFITDTQHIPYSASTTNPSGMITACPQVTNNNLIGLFVNGTPNNQFLSITRGNSTASSSSYDIQVYDATTQTTTFYYLTSAGRQLYKLLMQLGYVIQWNTGNLDTYNALPFMAALKVYIDWYYPSSYANTGVYTQLAALLKQDGIINFTVPSNYLAIVADAILFVNYDSDYFVSAWDNPVAPNTGLNSTIDIKDVSIQASSSYVPSGAISTAANAIGSTPTLYSTASGTTSASQTIRGINITQFALDSLKALTDYVKRNQLAGARSVDRYLATWGVQLETAKDHRSKVVGFEKIPIQIGDVYSQSDTVNLTSGSTGGSALGDFAGKGLGYGQKTFEYKTDIYGIFIILSTIVPSVGYFQGVDKHILHKEKTDFFNPNWDSLGVQAISALELYNSEDGNFYLPGMKDQVFGFAPRYAEYKCSRDRVTGDFRYRTFRNNGAEDAWYLMRDIYPFINAANWNVTTDFHHSFDFIRGIDAEQYNRIFMNASSDQDLFRVIYHFDIASWNPMKPLYDTYEFASDGKSLVMDVNGPKVN